MKIDCRLCSICIGDRIKKNNTFLGIDRTYKGVVNVPCVDPIRKDDFFHREFIEEKFIFDFQVLTYWVTDEFLEWCPYILEHLMFDELLDGYYSNIYYSNMTATNLDYELSFTQKSTASTTSGDYLSFRTNNVSISNWSK